MICQCCGKNPASTCIKIVSEGKLTEYALCAECARQFGRGNLFAGLGYRMNDIVREFFNASNEDDVLCPCCGASFSDIVRSGKVGCAECYHVFFDRLLPMIRQIHGSDVHRGKIPGGSLQVQKGGKLAVRVKDVPVQSGDEKNEEVV